MANFSVSRILSIFVLFAVASCTHNFDAYRLYQLDKGGELFGSQRAAINIFASTTSKSGTLSRSVVLIPHQEVQLDQLETILQERKADGVIILLPPRNTIGSTFLEQWNQLEQDLLGRSFTIPVFFAFEDEVGHIYDDVQTMSVRSNNPVAFWQFPFLENYRLYASIPEPQPIKDVTVTNYKGWLRGTGGDYEKDGGVRPTIAVVAHYDAFGVVPALSSQNVQSAGAAVTVLELARLFSKLYAQQRTQGAYNLLFLLTGGGYHNYAGTKHLLSHLDNQALDSIEFALCLDDIASAKEADWYIHVSRPPKEEKVKSFFGTLNATSNGNLHLVHKKINISQSDIDWEHEIFSRKKVFAGTLSAKSTPEAGLTKAATFEAKVDTAALIKKIKTIAESIAKHIYGLEGKDLKVFDGSLDVNADFVQSWLNALTQHNRLQSFIQKDKPLLQSLQKTLEDYTEASSETFSLTVESADIENEGELRATTDYFVYDGLSTSVSAYRVKPVSFDVLFSLVNVVYLSLLYAVIKGPQETIQQVQKLFNDDSKKRKKN